MRHLCNLLLVPALLASLTLSVEAGDPSSGPEDAVLLEDKPQNVHWYQNNYFNFRMAIPGGWSVMLNKQVAWFIHDTHMRKQIKEGIVFPLLAITKYPPGKPGPKGQFNSNIILYASNLSLTPPPGPGVKSAKELLDIVNATEAKLGAAPYTTKDGKSDCQRFRLLSNPVQTDSHFDNIVCMRNGYAIFFQSMAESEAEIAELESILQTLLFD